MRRERALGEDVGFGVFGGKGKQHLGNGANRKGERRVEKEKGSKSEQSQGGGLQAGKEHSTSWRNEKSPTYLNWTLEEESISRGEGSRSRKIPLREHHQCWLVD